MHSRLAAVVGINFQENAKQNNDAKFYQVILYQVKLRLQSQQKP